MRENVKSTFLQLFECLKRRENELLSELDEILESYHSYRNEIVKVTQQRKDLEKLKQMNEQELRATSAKALIENHLKEINKELNLLKEPKQPQMVRFVCDNNKRLLSEIDILGEYVDNTRIHYKSKIDSVVSVCKGGKGIDQLCDPRGVTVVNTTGMIYVADCWNDCVKVFDNTGKYLSRIGDNTGNGKMDRPHGYDHILSDRGSNSILIFNSRVVGMSCLCCLCYKFCFIIWSTFVHFADNRVDFATGLYSV